MDEYIGIAQYSALYSPLGTTYGGNGTTTFALACLRCQQANAITGAASVTLTTQQILAHTYTQQFANVLSTTNAPSGNVVSQITAADGEGLALTASGYAPAISALVAGALEAVSPAGDNQPVNTMPPYLGMNYIVCLNGVYPSRPS